MKFRRLFIALAAIAITVAAVIWDAVNRWRAMSNALVERLRGTRRPPVVPRYGEADLAGLPVPVARYFRKVLQDGHPIITHARITQNGHFRIGDAANGWKPFAAVEDFVSTPPGFVWDARIAMAPGLHIFVRDGIVEGHGSMVASVSGLVKLVEAEDTSELLAGALQRYLAEAVWFPTALLPSQGVNWTAIDDRNAQASITAGQTTVSLDFRFGADGLVSSVYTPGRFREEGGKLVPRPWMGSFSRYEERRHVLIPVRGEATWLLPDGRLPYWRGAVVRADYDYAE